MLNAADDKRADVEGVPGPDPGLWQRIVSAPEGKFLIAGLIIAFLHVVALGLTRLRSPQLSQSLLAMTTTHILLGRAAGMSSGYGSHLSPGLVVIVSMTVESFMVLLFYPLFVFSYRRLIVIQPLEDTMRRARRAAKAHQAKIMKFGVPGLLLFVWFPFLMTGPLVGSVIGFLIGLRPWVTVAVVLGGTYAAILCWSIILHRVYEDLKLLGTYVPFVFVGVILLVAVSIRIRYAFSRSGDRLEE